MRILIIGASKGIGLETTRQALVAGYDVRALARSAAAIPLSNSRLEKVQGDALNSQDVEAALARRVRRDVRHDLGDVDEVVDGVPAPHADAVTVAHEPVLLADVRVRAAEIDDGLVAIVRVPGITELVHPGRAAHPVGAVSSCSHFFDDMYTQ